MTFLNVSSVLSRRQVAFGLRYASSYTRSMTPASREYLRVVEATPGALHPPPAVAFITDADGQLVLIQAIERQQRGALLDPQSRQTSGIIARRVPFDDRRQDRGNALVDRRWTAAS